MLSKDAWPRCLLYGWALTAAWGVVSGTAGCNPLGRGVYYPAPTPIFMEEGLREEPGGGQPTIPVKAADGISGLLNPAKVEVAKAAHAAEQEPRGQELPPPTQPPTAPP